jgi:hypothetical protein
VIGAKKGVDRVHVRFLLILGSTAELRKATVSFNMSLCVPNGIKHLPLD